MLVPLVLPERLVLTTLVLPELLHVVQDALGLLACRLEDARDVEVLSAVVTELGVRAIAVVRPGIRVRNEFIRKLMGHSPEAVDGPVVCRAGGGLRVPELHLEDLTLDFSTTGVLDRGGVLATQWGRVGADRWASKGRP